jgi:hypothetical protein
MIRILAECRLQDTEFRRANIDEQGTVLIDVVELYCLNMMMFLELCLLPYVRVVVLLLSLYYMILQSNESMFLIII